MAHEQSTSPQQFLHRLLPGETILNAAVEHGFVQRRRKIAAVPFILLVILTVCGRSGQCLAELRRALEDKAGVLVARSSFWKRMSPALEKVLHSLLLRLQSQALANAPTYSGLLKGFRDVVAGDATVIQVRSGLAKLWKGTSTEAGIKVHTLVRVLTGELLRHQITAETRHESRVLGLGHWAKDMLFLLDRGYAWASLWWRIHRVGGFFLMPLKTSFIAQVVEVNPGHSGSRTRPIGKSVWALAKGRGRKCGTIDVQCAFSVEVRPYGRERGRRFTHVFRVVGLWNREAKRYRFYVTNIPVGRLEPAELSELYRLRWQVELFYKVGKGALGLDELTSSKPHIVRTMVKAALIRATVAMQAQREAAACLPPGRWTNAQTWVKVWSRFLGRLLLDLVRRRFAAPGITWRRMAALAMDPNRARMPLRHWCLVEVP